MIYNAILAMSTLIIIASTTIIYNNITYNYGIVSIITSTIIVLSVFTIGYLVNEYRGEENTVNIKYKKKVE